jgi:hypothetical protein
VTDYIYRALEKRIDEPEWRRSRGRDYSMKHHAKINVPKDAEWIPKEQMWVKHGWCYKVVRTPAIWESFDY